MSGVSGGRSAAEEALSLLIALTNPATIADRVKSFVEAEKSAKQAQDELAAKVKEHQDTVTKTAAKAVELGAREAALAKAESDLQEARTALDAMVADYKKRIEKLRAITGAS